MLTAGSVVRQLGGEVLDSEEDNLKALASEIEILREKVKQADDAEGRAERRLGGEITTREAAETRARIAEEALGTIEFRIADAKRKALAKGAPLRLKDETVALHIEPLGGPKDVIRDGEITRA